MGGTSTDVSHWSGAYERTFDAQVAGVRVRAPMMQIHTVAAGGGSILHFDGARFRVGPDSAGANPGPASYRRGGPLAVTDCNVMLGRLNPDFFPRIFGRNADQKLDRDIVAAKFEALAEEISASSGKRISAEEAAEGFMKIAVANMANAIKEISIQRGYDVSKYTLACFGGAGGQHACRVADELGMKRIFLHPFAGVLSAYGMGLADVRALRHRTIETQLNDAAMPTLTGALDELAREGEAELLAQGIDQSAIEIERHVHIKYAGTDAPLLATFGDLTAIKASFEEAHRRQYGFIVPDKALIVDSVSIEAIGRTEAVADPVLTFKRARRRRAQGAGAVLGRGRASPGAGAGPRRDAPGPGSGWPRHHPGDDQHHHRGAGLDARSRPRAGIWCWSGARRWRGRRRSAPMSIR